MGATSVDQLNVTNWTLTGVNVSIPQYSVTIEVKWTDEMGVKHTYGPTVHQYPNDISDMPLSVKKEYALEMIYQKVRVLLGIDTWEDEATVMYLPETEKKSFLGKVKSGLKKFIDYLNSPLWEDYE